MQRARKILIAILILLVVYSLCGFIVTPLVLRQVAEARLTELLGRRVQIQDIDLNPYALSLRLEGLRIDKRQQARPFAELQEFYVNLQALSVLKRAVIVREVRLRGPFLSLARDVDGQYNFADLLQRFAAADDPPAAEAPGEPVRFSINNIQLLDGHIEISDRQQGREHLVTDIDLTLPFLSNMAYASDIFVKPYFAAMVNETPFELRGRTKPFADSRQTELDLNLINVNLPSYFTYLPMQTGLKLESGFLNMTGSLVFTWKADRAPQISVGGRVELQNLKLSDERGRPLLQTNLLEVAVAPSRLLRGELRVERVRVHAPQVHIIRDAAGEVNLHGLFPAAGGSAEAPPKERLPLTISVAETAVQNVRVFIVDQAAVAGDVPSPAPDEPVVAVTAFGLFQVVVDTQSRQVAVERLASSGGRLDLRRAADGQINLLLPLTPPAAAAETPAREAGPGQPWRIDLAAVRLSDYALSWDDAAAGEPVSLIVAPVEIAAEGLSTSAQRQGRVDLTCRVNASATLDLEAAVALSPLNARGTVAVEGLEPAWFQSYIGQGVDMLVTGGRLATSGSWRFAAGPGRAPQLGFRGDAALRDLAAVDARHAEDLLRFQALELRAIDLGYAPLDLKIGQVTLARPHLNVAVDPAGRPNLLALMHGKVEGGGAQSSEAPAPGDGSAVTGPPELAIERVEVSDGRIDFIDRSIDPVYQASIEQLAASLAKLSSRRDARAEIRLKGLYNKQAPLQIEGAVNPLAENVFADLKVRFDNMGLSGLTPYSGKFLGYRVAKGKLALDLAYHIEDRQLAAQNRLTVDQFDFGRPVASPQATDLPVKMAVALLKDRNGRINLDIPVKGRLDDPEFSVVGIVLQVLRNLVVKAATSPFALIGALVGGEDLNHLEFEAGLSELTEPTRAKLDALIEALYERPGIELEVSGFVDPQAERPVLEEAAFRRLLQVQKLKRVVAESGQAAQPVEQIEISPEEYDEYLWRAYKAADFDKPRNLLGMVKKLPESEMAKALRSRIQVDDRDLKLLARQRAQRVKAYLLASTRVDPQRVFVIEPAALTAQPLEGVGAARVDLSLR